jgi:hypothetical protein
VYKYIAERSTSDIRTACVFILFTSTIYNITRTHIRPHSTLQTKKGTKERKGSQPFDSGIKPTHPRIMISLCGISSPSKKNTPHTQSQHTPAKRNKETTCCSVSLRGKEDEEGTADKSYLYFFLKKKEAEESEAEKNKAQ